jgi:hypothetical protein
VHQARTGVLGRVGHPNQPAHPDGEAVRRVHVVLGGPAEAVLVNAGAPDVRPIPVVTEAGTYKVCGNPY